MITSNPGPSLFLVGGVEAFSYSVILLYPGGGEGVVLWGLSLLAAWVRASPNCSCSDTAKAASAAICSADAVVVVPVPASLPVGDREIGSESCARSPCWSDSEAELRLLSRFSFLETVEGSGCIKRLCGS